MSHPTHTQKLSSTQHAAARAGAQGTRAVRAQVRKARNRFRGHANVAMEDLEAPSLDAAYQSAAQRFLGEVGVIEPDAADEAQTRSRECRTYLAYLQPMLAAVAPQVSQCRPEPPEGGVAAAGVAAGLFTLAAIAKCVRDKPRVSVDGVVAALVADGVFAPDPSAERRQHMRYTVFGLASLLHLMYRPVWLKGDASATAQTFLIESESAPSLTRLACEIHEHAGRQLQNLRLSYGAILPPSCHFPTTQPYGNASRTVIESAHVNAVAIYKVGKIKVQWIHTITSHLDFDDTNRTLFFFCLPSFCRLHAGARDTIFAQFLGVAGEPYGAVPVSATGYMQEIIKSFFLIYGDRPAAQELYKLHETGKLDREIGFRDPVLDELCHPSSVHPSEGNGRSTYIAEVDFPLFGSRLKRLQDFVVEQRPHSLLDLWRDKRDMSRWTTLWAATILAITGLLLAMIQIGLSIAQVYYSAQNPPKL